MIKMFILNRYLNLSLSDLCLVGFLCLIIVSIIGGLALFWKKMRENRLIIKNTKNIQLNEAEFQENIA